MNYYKIYIVNIGVIILIKLYRNLEGIVLPPRFIVFPGT